MSVHVEDRPLEEQLERAWWLRVPAVLIAPAAVFAALRDDSKEAVRARQEPVLLILGAAGIAAVLLTRTARTLLNDGAYSPIVIPVWAFIAGTVMALGWYWLLGALLYGSARVFGGLGSYRRARHVLAFALTPFALSLATLWPIRIALYGTDLFRTGGDDFGRGDAIFGGFVLGFVAWSAILLVIGVRTVHGWTWLRAGAAVALAAALPALVVLASSL